jgi:tetratricopeptide (TPR) repeat protein
VEALLDDLRRHRGGLPVLARRASARYRVRKFVARHRAAVAGSAAFVLLLLASVVALARQQREEARERARAEAEAARATQVTAFVLDLFETQNTAGLQGDTLTAFDLARRAGARIPTLGDHPELQVDLARLVGHLYMNLEAYGTAQPYLEQALALARVHYGEGHPEVAEATFDLGVLYHQMGHFGTADSLFTRWQALNAARLGAQDLAHAERLAVLARYRMHGRDAQEAIRLLGQALGLYRRLDPGHARVPAVMGDLGAAYVRTGQPQQAEPYLREALQRLRGVDFTSYDLPDYLLHALPEVLTYLGYALQEQGRLGEAEVYLREAGAFQEARGDTLSAATNAYVLGLLLADGGRYEEAEVALREGGAVFARTFGENYVLAVRFRRAVGDVRRRAGAYVAAEPILLEAYRSLEAQVGADHRYTREALASLVALYDAWGRPEAAAPYRARLGALASVGP